ncbi:MAG: hypothetical protein ACK5LV_06005 [Lachnospirales bacterium]
MNIDLDYRLDPIEPTKMTLKGMYKSMVGIVNIVIIIATIGLLIRFWSDVNIILKVILILCALFFPLIQPIIIYKRFKKQFEQLPEYLKINFNDEAFEVSHENMTGSEKFYWNKITKIHKDESKIIIYVSEYYGYVFTRKSMGEDFKILYDFLLKK